MKLVELEEEIRDLFIEDGFTIEKEFVTTTGARVDLAVLQNNHPVLAIEFEESYKWMRARSLYDAVKADREGFPNLAIVYAFEQRGLKNCWIFDYIKEDLDLDARIIHPDSIGDLKDIYNIC